MVLVATLDPILLSVVSAIHWFSHFYNARFALCKVYGSVMWSCEEDLEISFPQESYPLWDECEHSHSVISVHGLGFEQSSYCSW